VQNAVQNVITNWQSIFSSLRQPRWTCRND